MLTCYSSHSRDPKWDLKPNLNILFCLCFVTCGRDGRACAFLFAPTWSLTCLTPRVLACGCCGALWNWSQTFACRNFWKDEISCRPRWAHGEPKNELTIWLLIGAYFDSVFHAAYRHGSSVGLCLRIGVLNWGLQQQSGRLCRVERCSLPAHRHTNEWG